MGEAGSLYVRTMGALSGGNQATSSLGGAGACLLLVRLSELLGQALLLFKTYLPGGHGGISAARQGAALSPGIRRERLGCPES